MADADSGARRRIYLMPDYSSSSLWSDDPHGMVRLEQLPLSEQTKRDLVAWSERCDAWLEAHVNQRDYDEAADLAEGQRLWRIVRHELGPAFEVGYAYFDADPDDELGATKRIEWAPAAD